MYSQTKYSLLLCVFASASVFAKDCIDVHDAANSKIYCEKFSSEQRQVAKKYGLSLGMPYTKAKQFLLKRGWTQVKDDEEFEEYKTEDPFMSCGSGWNAICWAIFIRRKESIELVLRGVDTETLLAAVFQLGSND